MSWMLWLIVGWFALNVFATIGLIGKPREPIKPGAAAVAVAIWVVLILLVIVGGHANV